MCQRCGHGECIKISRFFNYIFRYPVNVPSGIAHFPNDFQPLARTLVGHRYKRLIQYTKMPGGGHFAAMEEPKLFGDDVFSFVHKVEHLEKMKKWKSKVWYRKHNWIKSSFFFHLLFPFYGNTITLGGTMAEFCCIYQNCAFS